MLNFAVELFVFGPCFSFGNIPVVRERVLTDLTIFIAKTKSKHDES